MQLYAAVTFAMICKCAAMRNYMQLYRYMQLYTIIYCYADIGTMLSYICSYAAICSYMRLRFSYSRVYSCSTLRYISPS